MPCRLAVSSMSLGRCFAGHSLDHRLDLAQKYGYQGIELFFEDLLDTAKDMSGCCDSQDPPHAAQVAAARRIYHMCAVRNLEIICLQPFMHYDGLTDRAEHARRRDELALWIDLAHELRTDMIQIPSSFLPPDQVTGNIQLIVADLREAADMGLHASPPVRFTYESLSWGTRVDTWELCWDIVRRVDRTNLGMCLDTFHIGSRLFADPASPTWQNPGAREAVQQSMARLVAEVDVSKVFYVQVVDGERLRDPLVEGHELYNASQPVRMTWSRNCRLFYGEQERGAYMPVREISSAIFHGLGFEGWVSLELFNRRMSERSPDVPEEMASRGAASWDKLVQDLKLYTASHGPLMACAISSNERHDSSSGVIANELPQA